MVINLLEVDSLIEKFITTHKSGIENIHHIYLKNSNSISVRATIEELMGELKTGCVSFLNKESDIEELDSYLFYIINAFIKSKAKPLVKRKTDYLCPGCLFVGREIIISLKDKLFKCNDCLDEMKSTTDPKRLLLLRTFFKHNKFGYKCQDCERFIPHPIDDSPTISCPYYDCCFVGNWSTLNRMYHPTIQSNPEKLILDSSKNDFAMNTLLVSDDDDAYTQLEVAQDINNKIKLLEEVIENQSNNVPYNSTDFTVKHKLFVYKSFEMLLKKHPIEMVNYLLNKSRSGGFQHKIFQEYVQMVEQALPFSYQKNNKIIKVESLLDENLNLFEGISSFEGIVSDKLSIKNGTTEFYIGGRKAAYTKPYYIGKLLSIMDESKKSLMDNVIEYSFNKIKLKDIKPGEKVIVSHLRVPPHYQMGGMVYINRIRKKIVDRANYLINKESNG